MCPYQRLAPCLTTDRPWLGVGMVRQPLPYDSFLRDTPVVYPGASPRSTRTRCDRGGCLLYLGGGGAHPADKKSPAGACCFPAASRCAPPEPIGEAHYNETSTEVYAIHPSGLPLARDPWMVQGSFGFPSELRTPPLPATHAEGGARPSNTCLKLRTRHQAGPPICESTRYVRPRVATFSYCRR